MDELTMDELTAFRDFRSDTPGPSAGETMAARNRLIDAINSPATRRAPWHRRTAWLRPFARTRFWAPVAAAAAVTAVVVTMTLVAAPRPAPAPKPKPSPASTHQSPRPSRVPKDRGASKPAGGHGSTGQPAAKPGAGAASPAGAAGSVGAPGSPGGTGPGASPAPTTPTTTVLTASTAEISPGQTVKLTAIVTDQAGNNIVGGTVSYFLYPQPYAGFGAPASSIPVCSFTPVTYNTAADENIAACTFTPTAEYEGPYTVSAGYSGYGQYRASESGIVDLNVGQPTTTALTVSPAQVSAGQTITLTAVVTDQGGDNLSGGTMDFYLGVGGTAVLDGVCTQVALSYDAATHDNVATCTYTPQNADSDFVMARYSGYDGLYQASWSGYEPLTVPG
jgi:hypothetical protein